MSNQQPTTNNQQRDKWLRSGLFSLLEKGAALVFSLGTTVLLLRGLTKEDFAAWGIFIIISYFVEMGRSGLIQNALMRHLAIHRHDRETYGTITTASFSLNFSFSIFSNVLLWLGASWIAQQYHVPQLAELLPVYFAINFFMAFYAHCYFVQQANSEFRGVFWGAVFFRGLPFVWALYCWFAGKPIELAHIAWAMLAGTLVGGFAVWLFARPFLFHSKKIDFQWIAKLFSFGKYVLGTNLSTMFYKNIDKLTLGHLLGPAAFAVYDAAGKVTQLVEMPSFSVAAVVFPKSAERMALEGAAGVKRLYERSVAATLAIILPFLALVLLFAEPIIWLFAGEQYMASADVLRLTAFFGLFLPFAVQFGTVLDSTGKPATNFVYTTFTALLNLGLSYWFVTKFGLFGAAFATLSGYAVSFVLMQVYLFKNFKINALNVFRYVPEVYKIGWEMLKQKIAALFNPTPDPSPERRGDVERSTVYAESPLLSGEGSGVGLNNAAANQDKLRNPETLKPCNIMDVVFFTLFRTDNPYSSISLSMAKELAKTHRVFYVNHPYSLKDLVRGLLSGDKALRSRLPWLLSGRVRYEGVETIPKNFVAAQPPLTLPINWLPKGRIYNFFQRLNNGIVLRAIRKVLRDHEVRNYVYINCYDPFYAGFLPKEMGAALCIYHCIDDITQNIYTAKHGADLEDEAVRNADVTFVTSTNLKKLKIAAFNRGGGVIPKLRDDISDRFDMPPLLRRDDTSNCVVTFFNAADVSVFKKVISEKYPRPVELEGRTGKIIGFIGNLDELRIDYLLLKKIALAHPDKTLLLVGPVNSPEPHEIGLDKLPNVVFTGSRRLEDLPPLLQHMDCTLIPFLCNTLTESIYPLKINEYLATEKPVVSTSFSDDIRSFADSIYLAENHADFINLIDEAIFENNPNLVQRRMEVANSNTWEARSQQFWDVVKTYAEKPIHLGVA